MKLFYIWVVNSFNFSNHKKRKERIRKHAVYLWNYYKYIDYF